MLLISIMIIVFTCYIKVSYIYLSVAVLVSKCILRLMACLVTIWTVKYASNSKDRFHKGSVPHGFFESYKSYFSSFLWNIR